MMMVVVVMVEVSAEAVVAAVVVVVMMVNTGEISSLRNAQVFIALPFSVVVVLDSFLLLSLIHI